MNRTLEAYRDVVVVNGERLTLEMNLDFGKKRKEEQRQYFGGDRTVGWFYLYNSAKLHPDTVMECVMSEAGDSITSLYKRHPIFASQGSLMTARNALMFALSEKIGLSIEAIGIEDEARGRTLGLSELSTGQLIDMLAERSGVVIAAKTDSYGNDLPGQEERKKLIPLGGKRGARYD